MDVNGVARIAYEANRLFCEVEGIGQAVPWSHASDDIKARAAAGVLEVYSSPEITPEEQHEAWYHYMVAHGWVYGLHKDEAAKTHPNLVPYADLSVVEQVKNVLSINIVRALIPYEHMQHMLREQERQPLLDFDKPLDAFDPSADLQVDPALVAQATDPVAQTTIAGDPTKGAEQTTGDGTDAAAKSEGDDGKEQPERQSEGVRTQADSDGRQPEGGTSEHTERPSQRGSRKR